MGPIFTGLHIFVSSFGAPRDGEKMGTTMQTSAIVARLEPLARLINSTQKCEESVEIPLKLRHFLPEPYSKLHSLSKDMALDLMDKAKRMRMKAQNVEERLEDFLGDIDEASLPPVSQHKLKRLRETVSDLRKKAEYVFRVLAVAVRIKYRRQDKKAAKHQTLH